MALKISSINAVVFDKVAGMQFVDNSLVFDFSNLPGKGIIKIEVFDTI